MYKAQKNASPNLPPTISECSVFCRNAEDKQLQLELSGRRA